MAEQLQDGASLPGAAVEKFQILIVGKLYRHPAAEAFLHVRLQRFQPFMIRQMDGMHFVRGRGQDGDGIRGKEDGKMDAPAVIAQLLILFFADDLMVRIGLVMDAVPPGRVGDPPADVQGKRKGEQRGLRRAVPGEASVVGDEQSIRIKQPLLLHDLQHAVQRPSGGEDQTMPGCGHSVQHLFGSRGNGAVIFQKRPVHVAEQDFCPCILSFCVLSFCHGFSPFLSRVRGFLIPACSGFRLLRTAPSAFHGDVPRCQRG